MKHLKSLLLAALKPRVATLSGMLKLKIVKSKQYVYEGSGVFESNI